MQKLKFPTFSGDIRDYKQFKELFIHFTKHLDQTECLYQLVESMQRPAERKKIKPCTSIYQAWQILDESYGDDDRLVDILLCDIENLNSYTIKGRVNLAEMDKFTESIQNFITQVEAGVEIALIRLSGLSKKLSGQVDRPAEVIRRTSESSR